MNKFLCSILIILSASSLARAEDVYFGATLTPSDKGRISYDGDGGRQQHDGTRRNPAVGVFAGYVLSPSWAVEAGYRGIGGQHLPGPDRAAVAIDRRSFGRCQPSDRYRRLLVLWLDLGRPRAEIARLPRRSVASW